MSNLLPQAQQAIPKATHRFRIATLYMHVVLVLMILFAIALIPSYVISRAREKVILKESNMLSTKGVPDQGKLDALVANANATLAVFPDTDFSFSQRVIEPLLVQKAKGIHLTAFAYSAESGGSLSGTAETEALLTAFIKSLSNNSNFIGVTKAASSTKGVSITFSLSFGVPTI